MERTLADADADDADVGADEVGDAREAEARLIRRSQLGERRAFEELVRRTARLIFSRVYLESGGGDPHRAEDLVQETFLTAWRSIGQVTDPSGFRAWLLSVARTVTLDARRRETRKKRSGGGVRRDESALETMASPGADPADEAEAEEERQRVLAALRSLPEEYRGPLTMRYIAGADYETIARELGLSNGSLRGMLGRGLSMLRQRLGRKVAREDEGRGRTAAAPPPHLPAPRLAARR